MDCTDVQRTLSEALDTDISGDSTYAGALEHCRGCNECAAFARALVAMRPLAPPAPPNDLVARVMDDVRTEALLAEHVPELAVAGEPPPTRTRPAWTPRMVALASAAAVLVAGVAVARVALERRALPAGTVTGSASPPEAASPDRQADGGGAAGRFLGTAPSAPSLEGLASDDHAKRSAQPATTTAPPLIAYEDWVWALRSTAQPPPGATEAAPVVSALGEAARSPHDVLRDPADADTLYVRTATGTVEAFTRVTRTYGGRRFGMRPGTAIDRYGVWPGLPASLSAPSSADGSPSLYRAGTDVSGVPVYARNGSGPLDGFAVAPGTPVGDPAAGNPGWTWWEPLP